jgi:hypothetical protein
MRQMKKIMNKSNDTGTINTVVKTAIKNANALEDGKLDAVAGGWAATPHKIRRFGRLSGTGPGPSTALARVSFAKLAIMERESECSRSRRDGALSNFTHARPFRWRRASAALSSGGFAWFLPPASSAPILFGTQSSPTWGGSEYSDL